MFFWRRKVRERDLERELQSDLELEVQNKGRTGYLRRMLAMQLREHSATRR